LQDAKKTKNIACY